MSNQIRVRQNITVAGVIAAINQAKGNFGTIGGTQSPIKVELLGIITRPIRNTTLKEEVLKFKVLEDCKAYRYDATKQEQVLQDIAKDSTFIFSFVARANCPTLVYQEGANVCEVESGIFEIEVAENKVTSAKTLSAAKSKDELQKELATLMSDVANLATNMPKIQALQTQIATM